MQAGVTHHLARFAPVPLRPSADELEDTGLPPEPGAGEGSDTPTALSRSSVLDALYASDNAWGVPQAAMARGTSTRLKAWAERGGRLGQDPGTRAPPAP